MDLNLRKSKKGSNLRGLKIAQRLGKITSTRNLYRSPYARFERRIFSIIRDIIHVYQLIKRIIFSRITICGLSHLCGSVWNKFNNVNDFGSNYCFDKLNRLYRTVTDIFIIFSRKWFICHWFKQTIHVIKPIVSISY